MKLHIIIVYMYCIYLTTCQTLKSIIKKNNKLFHRTKYFLFWIYWCKNTYNDKMGFGYKYCILNYV